MKPLSLKEKAISCRKQGYSYNIISGKLGLSKATLSDWLKEIPYKPNAEVIKRIKTGPAKTAKLQHNRKVASIIAAKKLAKKELRRLSKRDLWLLGIGLYLGEGTKSQESVQIINSDPAIIKIALGWFRKVCKLSTENFAVAVHLYPDNNIRKTINYWSRVTGIPKKQFRKTQIDRRTNKSIRKRRRLPYGTAHITVKSCGKKEFGVFLHRRIMGWIEVTLNQFNMRV